ncbi:hypothetical protein [Ornithinimicrobium tianjinense]|nr:hypothetical protein [Ornithinimicrobium tianjinense]
MADSAPDPVAAEALARAVDAVYAVAPEAFVATRKEQVARLRAEGLREVATQVAALSKPSVAAAAVNALVRADDPVVEELLDVGARMRHAQSAMDMAALAGLRGERDDLLAAWVAAARAHSPGGSLTAAVEAEVRDTAVAALADAAATEVVTSGSLTRGLSYSGFGEVDVADAVARTSTGVVFTRIEGGRAAREEPEEPVEQEEPEEPEEPVEPAEAQEQVEPPEPEAQERVEPAGPEAAEPAEPVEHQDGKATADRVAELEMELDEAEKAVAAARAARKAAADADQKAADDAEVAREQVAQAERLLAQARAHQDTADASRTKAAAALESAEEDLRSARDQRDLARAALEEAEDS